MIGRLVQVLVVVLVVAQAARLTFQPDMRDGLRQADQLFHNGQYYAALHLYASLAAVYDDAPELALRVGMVRAIRGEYDLAEHALWQAFDLGLQGQQRDLAALYQGHVLDRRGRSQRALQMWLQIPSGSPLDAPRRVLRAERALYQGDYAAAEQDYRAARDAVLSDAGHDLVVYRLALLRAARDPEAALVELDQARSALVGASRVPTSPFEPFFTPLLADTSISARQLHVVLQADTLARPHLLGQFYLDTGLFSLAEAQFAQVAPDSPYVRAAAAYAAYTRWRAGNIQDGVSRLQALVEAYPDDAQARTLLALVYLAQEDSAAARVQIDTITAESPADPDTHLAWANWYTAQRDYVAASTEYQRALAQVPPDQRGTYALLVARFHLRTLYEVCRYGLPVAELAARDLSDNNQAWTTLAASLYHCGEPAAAAEAARTAMAHGAGAEAAFYLGVALADLGDRAAARHALVWAADLSPASVWRERAEVRLAMLP